MRALTDYVSQDNSSDKLGRMSFVLRAMVDEIADELDDVDEEMMSGYWVRIGHVIAWIGSGDTDVLPDELKPFAYKLMGQEMPEEETKELTA